MTEAEAIKKLGMLEPIVYALNARRDEATALLRGVEHRLNDLQVGITVVTGPLGFEKLAGAWRLTTDVDHVRVPVLESPIKQRLLAAGCMDQFLDQIICAVLDALEQSR